jgi:hypothetical protein
MPTKARRTAPILLWLISKLLNTSLDSSATHVTKDFYPDFLDPTQR